MTDTFAATHPEDPHRLGRSNWLRAAVLGATDGIVSISSLLIGVAAAVSTADIVFATGVAGLVAGAMSIAASEYISVSSQADIERAEIERERKALEKDPEGELAEMVAIWRERGLSAPTADLVAQELTQSDVLAAHLRDEVGLLELHSASPKRAAMASGAAFATAALLPLLSALLAPFGHIVASVLVATLVALLILGAIGARTGGAPVAPAMIRTALWGAVAMAATYAAGWLVGGIIG
ncbi:MAG: VIT family protein [Marinovum sp.]|nr:VIT family protein [Marinovum sp.]